MEQIAQTAAKVASELTPTSSELQQNSSEQSTAKIPRDVAQALFGLINRSRKQNGWAMREFDELKPQIATWYTDFARHGIPLSAYTELFNRAFDVRVNQISRGDTPMPMDSTLLVSQWVGENGLGKELRRREEERGRTLAANAASVCKWCLGTGWRQGDLSDPSKGFTRCDHSEPQGDLGL